MPARTLADVTVKDGSGLHVLQAELAQVQLRQSGGRDGCSDGGGCYGGVTNVTTVVVVMVE